MEKKKVRKGKTEIMEQRKRHEENTARKEKR